MVDTREIYVSGCHGNGKTTLIKRLAQMLDGESHRVYVVPEMSYPFMTDIGTVEFQIRYQEEMNRRKKVVKAIVDLGIYDYVICDRFELDVLAYSNWVFDKEFSYVGTRDDAFYILLTANTETILDRLEKRREAHRSNWKESKREYVTAILESFSSYGYMFDLVIDNTSLTISETVDNVLVSLYDWLVKDL